MSADEVGDLHSFGRYVKWAGMGQTYPVTVQAECPKTSNNRCHLSSTRTDQIVRFDERDLETIVIPGKTATSLICHHVTLINSFEFYNDNHLPQKALLSLTPYVTLYNPVLNDPSLTDPFTGQPLDGQLTPHLTTPSERHYLIDGQERQDFQEDYSRQCIAGLVSKHALMRVYDFPEHMADEFFRNDTKISFHLRGEYSLLERGQFGYGIRLTVD